VRLADNPDKEKTMRTLIRVSIPVETGNAAIKSGRLPQLISEAMTRLKPEAAYFMAENGARTAFFFVDLKDQSDIPVVAEPFFMELHATVDFQPVMNADDLKKGLSQISR
jgi:hypothetical protein